VQAEVARAEDEYSGLRVTLQSTIAGARLPIQVDIGFGDVVTPAAREVDYPSLLGMPAPRLRAYPPETVVAEKVQALVSLGMLNSRMKDFFDLWAISRMFPFEGPVLSDALRATFIRRATPLPAETPIALTQAFSTGRVSLFAVARRANRAHPRRGFRSRRRIARS
jgi:Nucleotidyl transferase AbiEii toxin, Type IV TA system